MIEFIEYTGDGKPIGSRSVSLTANSSVILSSIEKDLLVNVDIDADRYVMQESSFIALATYVQRLRNTLEKPDLI